MGYLAIVGVVVEVISIPFVQAFIGAVVSLSGVGTLVRIIKNRIR